LTVSRFLPARILKLAAAAGKIQPKYRPEPFPLVPVLAAGAKDGKFRARRPRTQGPFPPQETAFYVESAETFQAMNDLAAKRPDL
jgi:hypothetical protein